MGAPRFQGGMRKQICPLYGADVKYDKNRGDTNGEKCNESWLMGWEWEFKIEGSELDI